MMKAVQLIDDGRASEPVTDAATLAATRPIAQDLAGHDHDRDGEDGVDAFTLSKRLRYLDAVAGFGERWIDRRTALAFR